MSEFYTKDEVDALIAQCRQQTAEDCLRTLPFVVKQLVTHVGALKSMSSKFFEDNKDLASHRELVARVMEEVEARNPGKKLEDLLGEVAKESKKRVALGADFNLREGAKPAQEEVNAGLKNILGALE